jgi:hypothetical protein
MINSTIEIEGYNFVVACDDLYFFKEIIEGLSSKEIRKLTPIFIDDAISKDNINVFSYIYNNKEIDVYNINHFELLTRASEVEANQCLEIILKDEKLTTLKTIKAALISSSNSGAFSSLNLLLPLYKCEEKFLANLYENLINYYFKHSSIYSENIIAITKMATKINFNKLRDKKVINMLKEGNEFYNKALSDNIIKAKKVSNF